MKKSLLALAVLGAFAGAASAQSSVTLFGIVDVNARWVKNGDETVKQLGTDGINSSRLGFRGVEDLGGGLKAGFHIEGALSPDTGNASGLTFQRRSTVSLMGSFGEVRLGRDYTPSFWNLTVFDPFGTNGVGSFLNIINTLGSGATTLVRANNTIGYFLPSGLGGIYGQVQVAANEGPATATAANKYAGGRVGYAAGPFDVAVAYGETELVGNGKFQLFNIGGAWNFGMAKVTAQFVNAKTDTIGGVALDGSARTYQLGLIVPMGQGEIHAAYDQTKGDDVLDGLKARQVAVGYVYNLSKRTAVYGTYSHLKNDGTAFAVATPPSALSAFDDKSRGFEAGLRHSF